MFEIIVVALFGDSESERALEVAREACLRALRELGMKVVVRPVVMWRDLGCGPYPVTVVNGIIVSVGRAPTVEEILDALRSPYRASHRDQVTAPAAIIVSDDEAFRAAQEVPHY